ncbi:hypothetical protein [Flavobacterium sp.]|uniref:hypothetical protein n=1 Tax=Flavobacterium sp. TaxID=239 RepID=UPI0025ECEBCA|nr:hypothetical protein [Flavobacterium sp.]
MIFKDNQEAIDAIKANLKINHEFVEMRESSDELKALVNGDDFIDELIDKIEGIESEKKSLARKRYSRSIKDLFERLFQPIDNIYYATGGVKDYDITNDTIRTEFIKKIASIRDNKPLSEWIQKNAIKLMNTDPNGLIFLEYTTTPTVDIYPTYKSIEKIRYYESNGQLVEFVIFEPKVKDGRTFWRIVDDLVDRVFEQIGMDFVLIEELSFEHPFGQTPALICSNIQEPGEEEKLSAIDGIIDAAKEYARDQSFLTLYKIYKGNPIFWKYIQYCGECSGTGKNGDDKCGTCNGHGKMVSKNDVTDVVELPIPDSTDTPVIAPNIAGFISPDLDVWKQYNEELAKLEESIYKTHWGTFYGVSKNTGSIKTATEVMFDKQPMENKLNMYADFVEYIEWKISEWILNFYDTTKNKSESRITINLGRRYIIESYDTLLERYENAVKLQDNSVVLDKLFGEYLGAKYRNNPIDLHINLLKAKLEPYLHLNLKDVISIFGQEEAQRKVLFNKWWKTVTDYYKSENVLNTEFDAWFEINKKPIAVPVI